MAGGAAGKLGHNMSPPRRGASGNSSCWRDLDVRNFNPLASFHTPFFIKYGLGWRTVGKWSEEIARLSDW